MNREQILAAMEAILAVAEAESRDLNDAEKLAYEGHKNALAALDRRAAMRAEVQAARQSAPVAAPVAVAPVATAPLVGVRTHGPEASKDFENLAQFCEAAILRQNDQRLASHFRTRSEMLNGSGVMAEQRMDSGATGGFAIPVQFRETIMAVAGQSAVVRPRATVLPAGTPPDAEIEIPALDQTGAAPDNIFGGVKMGWTYEGGPKPETDAKFRLITLKPQELTGYITLTDKLLRNSALVGSYVASLMPQAIASAEDFAFISGNGVGKPLGFINAPAAYQQVRTASPSHVNVYDLVQMLSRVLSVGGSPVWVMSRAMLPIISLLTDPSGRYVFLPGFQILGSPGDTLLGYPVIWNQRSPALGSTGDIALADLKGYLIKDGSGPFIAYSEHVRFLNNETVVKIFTNVDGKPWLTEPLTGQDGRDTSPFVVLR